MSWSKLQELIRYFLRFTSTICWRHGEEPRYWNWRSHNHSRNGPNRLDRYERHNKQGERNFKRRRDPCHRRQILDVSPKFHMPNQRKKATAQNLQHVHGPTVATAASPEQKQTYKAPVRMKVLRTTPHRGRRSSKYINTSNTKERDVQEQHMPPSLKASKHIYKIKRKPDIWCF